MNSEKIPCTECGVMILPMTANETGGICKPCSGGYRAAIEAAKALQNETAPFDPYQTLWSEIMNREANEGLNSLSDDEQLLFFSNVFSFEVHSGGFYNYFDVFGEHHERVREALLELGAVRSLNLLDRATEILFGAELPNDDRVKRSQQLPDLPDDKPEPDWCVALGKLELAFYNDGELAEKIDAFVEAKGLVDLGKIGP